MSILRSSLASCFVHFDDLYHDSILLTAECSGDDPVITFAKDYLYPILPKGSHYFGLGQVVGINEATDFGKLVPFKRVCTKFMALSDNLSPFVS